jgi:phosphate:Na+ symporter
MSNGLRDVAGQRLRGFLQGVTKRPLLGVAVGTLVTALIQSSSATTTMVVGLANAGLLNLRQAISLVLGANIGTTITAWIVALIGIEVEIMMFALPAVGVGFFFYAFGKRRRTRLWGQALLGMGTLFVGLSFMKDAVTPLRGAEVLKNVVAAYGRYPLLGVLTGVGLTVLLQSSSATVAIVQTLAMTGAIPFATAIPVILGDNIGTTVTAEIASIGAGPPARRTARAHTLFNVFGVLYMLPLAWTFPGEGGVTSLYSRFIEWIFPGELTLSNIAGHMALAHTVFNMFNAIVVFVPAIKLLEWTATKLTIVGKADRELVPEYLDTRLLSTPEVALQQAALEIVRMLRLAQGAVRDAMKAFFESNERELDRVARAEEAVDSLQHDITQYLIQLSERELGPAQAEKLPVFVHTVNDIERVGDHAENLAELAERMIHQRLPFSEEAIAELRNMYERADRMMDEVAGALETDSRPMAKRALKGEALLNQMQIELHRNHVQRLSDGSCQLLSGLIFLDMVDNLEKIGDHITNIAQAILGGLRWDGIRRTE